MRVGALTFFDCAYTHQKLPTLLHRQARPQMALMGLRVSLSWWFTRHTSELLLLLLQESYTLCRCSRRFEGMGDDSLIVFIHAIFKTHLWINATLSHACILLCAQIMQHLAKWRWIRHTYTRTTLQNWQERLFKDTFFAKFFIYIYLFVIMYWIVWLQHSGTNQYFQPYYFSHLGPFHTSHFYPYTW